MKNRFILLPVLFSSWIVLFPASPIVSQTSNNFEVAKNIDIFTTLYKELNINYVDELSPGEMMKTGIDAMLASLDPYTVYISEAEIEDFKFVTTGQYGGIGALIHKQGEEIIISEPYEGTPAQEYGLKAGDQILEIDGKKVSGKSTSEVSTLLKGQPGTVVSILIRRPGMAEPMVKELTRQNVKVDNIPYYGMLEQNVGYIKLSGFTQHAGKEVKDAFLDLKKNNTLSGLILDLRDNGGGLLQEAVSITNIFVPKDEHVVSTKGKLPSKNYSYRTTNAPVDTEIPLVILVNNSSASASEIVAGAIQDLDRGVVIGQQTFGKGLVQNVIPISYNAQAKITVAKYYIPSGRCIQEIDYSNKDENGDSRSLPDSLITAYKTKNGRTVYDGHGIAPDIKVDSEEMSNIAISLMQKFLFFSYATKFEQEHDQIVPPDEFEVTDEIFDEFVAYIKQEGYDYTTRCEETLEKLKKYAEKEDYFDVISDEYEILVSKLEEHKKEDIYKYRDQISRLLKMEIIARYYYQKGKIISALSDDPEIATAIDLLNRQDSYLAILVGGTDKTNN
jgi:carboxyl-terminal processing protease